MKKCLECGYPNPDNINSCFKCGTPLDPPEEVIPETAAESEDQTTAKPARKPMPVWVTLLQVIVIFIFLGWAYNNRTSAAEESKRFMDDMKRDAQVIECRTHTIRYEVTGSTDCVSVTYSNSDGGTSQESEKSVPWKYPFVAYHGAFLYISAQNQKGFGSVTVTIYCDNAPIKTSTSSGSYVIASADCSL